MVVPPKENSLRGARTHRRAAFAARVDAHQRESVTRRYDLLSALDDLDKAPTLHLGQGAALHNADGIAHASRALLVMSVKLLGAGHHLAILGVTLALRGLDNNVLLPEMETTTPVRTLRELRATVSVMLYSCLTLRQRTSPLQSDGRAAP